MKGLLLKDFYMMLKYCRSYLLIAVVFFAMSFMSTENLIFVFYPCVISAMLPVTLLSIDERSRWLPYAATLPVTRAQIVSEKYLFGLIAQGVLLVVTLLVQAAGMLSRGAFNAAELMSLALMLVTACLFAASIILPVMFKLGVEKGRIAYLAVIGFICGASAIANTVFRDQLQAQVTPTGLLPILCIATFALYALSWRLSILFYQKREL